MKKWLILLSLILTSCSMTKTFSVTPEEEYNNAYVGKSLSDIMTVYGKPTNATSDGKNGMIVTYEETFDEFMSLDNEESSSESTDSYSTDYSSSDDEMSSSSTSESNTVSTTVYKHFYIDANNTCYKVETNDYLKGGQYRKYFNRVTIAEMSIVAALAIGLNLIF